MSLSAAVARMVRNRVARWPENPSADVVYELLRLLGRWRSQMLANTYISLQGARIWGGPFAGMEYVSAATEGALIPRLLGTYESELHAHLAQFAALYEVTKRLFDEERVSAGNIEQAICEVAAHRCIDTECRRHQFAHRRAVQRFQVEFAAGFE